MSHAGLPRIWILSQGRRGDLEQMLALANALGWPFAVKQLAFRGPAVPAFARRLLQPESNLQPPWPDAVLFAEAMATRVALDVQRRSGGRCKTICLGRPAGRVADFGLVLTTAQYRLKPAANVVELALPPGTAAGAAVRSPSSRIALLVGGSSFPDVLDGGAAAALARAALAYAATSQRVLRVLTSPRTGAEAVSALRRAVHEPHRLHVYGSDNRNPYRDWLAAADEVIVTSDSVSMMAEAVRLGKPVRIYALPQRRSLRLAASGWCRRHVLEADPVPLPLRPLAWLFDNGVLETTADRRHLFNRLADAGCISWFGDPASRFRPCPADADMTLAVRRIRQLIEGARNSPAAEVTT